MSSFISCNENLINIKPVYQAIRDLWLNQKIEVIEASSEDLFTNFPLLNEVIDIEIGEENQKTTALRLIDGSFIVFNGFDMNDYKDLKINFFLGSGLKC